MTAAQKLIDNNKVGDILNILSNKLYIKGVECFWKGDNTTSEKLLRASSKVFDAYILLKK